MKVGRRERIGLLTHSQRDLARHAHERIMELQQKRDEYKKNPEYRDKNSEEPKKVQELSFELASISRAISRLEDDVEKRISHIVIDLDLILESEILKPWVNRNIPTWNNLNEKLTRLNATESQSGFHYKNMRVVVTHSRPQRFWLNENYFEENKMKNKFISYLSLDYVLQGIKRSWTRKYGNIKINVRDTLREALESEKKYNQNELIKKDENHNNIPTPRNTKERTIVPRSTKDAMTIVEIYHRVRRVKNNFS